MLPARKLLVVGEAIWLGEGDACLETDLIGGDLSP
jgi:hypothetical protein